MALPGSGAATRSTCCALHHIRCSGADQPAIILNTVVVEVVARFALHAPQLTSLLALQAINFASYDAYKLLLQGDDAELGRFKSFVAGALAGECTTSST